MTTLLTNHDEWFKMFYEQVGRELSLAREGQRETHTWVLTLTVGVFTAFVTIGGNNLSYPTENSFLGVVVITPLMFRFFVRSCLEYQILHRWTTLRDALDAYFFSKGANSELHEAAFQYLQDIVPKYYFQRRAAMSFCRMLVDNIKLAYGWPFLVLLSLLIWGFAKQSFTPNIRYALWVFVPWMILEGIWFFTYRGFKHAEPSHEFDFVKLAFASKTKNT